MRSRFQGAAGHSQGVVSAVVVSASDSFESFNVNFAKALLLLKAIGARAQEAFPITHIDPFVVQDCAEKEGIPSAMLSVYGIEQSLLQKFIDLTNQFNENKIAISLYNSSKHFIVTGPPKSLYGLVLALRKAKVESDVDQSKVPFSKRKPNFVVRFLPVQAPFHSSYLNGCTAQVLEHDVANLWTRDDLKLAVYHTETGENIALLDQDITTSLCVQIFEKPIHWNKVISFPIPATHLVDFGPGGSSGIGSMCVRNLDGTGVVNIATGKEVELYDSLGFKKVEPWSNVWSPKLVKKTYILLM
jgi:fatty acid synthase subunit beta